MRQKISVERAVYFATLTVAAIEVGEKIWIYHNRIKIARARRNKAFGFTPEKKKPDTGEAQLAFITGVRRSKTRAKEGDTGPK